LWYLDQHFTGRFGRRFWPLFYGGGALACIVWEGRFLVPASPFLGRFLAEDFVFCLTEMLPSPVLYKGWDMWLLHQHFMAGFGRSLRPLLDKDAAFACVIWGGDLWYLDQHFTGRFGRSFWPLFYGGGALACIVWEGGFVARASAFHTRVWRKIFSSV
jgi:hypothetical protein